MSVDKFIQDGQDPKIVEKLHDKLLDMLTSGESINYITVQKKPAVTILPDSIAITNKRLFLCEFTKLGLATNFEIFKWEDIKDISFKEEIFGSKVTVIPFTGENISIDYIPKTQARKLYQLIKEALEINQSERELLKSNDTKPTDTVIEYPKKDEVSNLQSEEVINADSLYPDPVVEATPEPESDETDELTKKLVKLKSLYDKQLITQAEYEMKKSELLSDL